MKIFNFRQTQDRESDFWSVPVNLRCGIVDCDVFCGHLCYRWTIYCPPQAADCPDCPLKFISTECGRDLSQKMRHGGSGWTGTKRIFWFALKNCCFLRQQPLPREKNHSFAVAPGPLGPSGLGPPLNVVLAKKRQYSPLDKLFWPPPQPKRGPLTIFRLDPPLWWTSRRHCSFGLIFRNPNPFSERRHQNHISVEKYEKKFRVFLTWNVDVAETENGRTLFSWEVVTSWVFRYQNVNTWRLIMYPTKEGYFVCQMSHWSPKCASMRQC